MTKILLVEDDTTIVENLTGFLSEEGFLVKSASGQGAAISLLENEEFRIS